MIAAPGQSMRVSPLALASALLAGAVPLAPAHAADGVDCLYERLTEDERAGVYGILSDLSRGDPSASGETPAAMSRVIGECMAQNGWTDEAASQAIVVLGNQMAFADARGRAAAWGLSTSQLEDLFLALGSDNMIPSDGNASPAALDALFGLLAGMGFGDNENVRDAALAWLQANASISDEASRFNEI